MSQNNNEFWKNKLMAFLHDPPCKCFDIGRHEQIADSFRKGVGFIAEDQTDFKAEDHIASAADRFPFPVGKCTAKFTGGEDFPFRHPFCNASLIFKTPMETSELAEEKFQVSIGALPADLDWQSKFYLYWRRWPEESAKQDQRLAYLPADTRLPDHTIWNHMSLCSAFTACKDQSGGLKPAFLHFQIGPVQEFIAAAKSTRDLASGSYLLAWLTAQAIKAVTDEIGPDCVVFPSLRGQPVFDLLHQPLFQQIKLQGKKGKEETLWDRIYDVSHDPDGVRKLLRPTLPNRFCVLVPSDCGEDLARKAEAAVHKTLREAGDCIWPEIKKGYCGKEGDEETREWQKFEPTKCDRQRWDRQLELFPQITWSVTPWNKIDDKSTDLQDALKDNVALALKVPEADRRKYFYPFNQGFYWQAHLQNSVNKMAVRRNLRDFEQLKTDEEQDGSPKDRLTGRDEVIGKTPYSAISLIKRFFFESVIQPKINCREGVFWAAAGYADTRSISERNRLSEDEMAQRKTKSANPYIAVIAMDGDHMGKWMSGEKSRPLLEKLAGKAPEYFKSLGLSETVQRALTPSYHAQFSEALANFSLHVADKVVSVYGGQLIYAGGDDVLAMLPSSEALECAMALRCCFRGEKMPENIERRLGQADQPVASKEGNGFVDAGTGYPLMMPGFEADVSCGIAIGHYSHPLQALVREAQSAEKRAKADEVYSRSAFAVNLVKRSGEIIHWGGKWDSAALPLFSKFCELTDDGTLSGRFPYALAALLRPYDFENAPPDAIFKDVVLKELKHVVGRQSDNKLNDLPHAGRYLDECVKNKRWQDFVNLFLAAAFINRQRGEE